MTTRSVCVFCGARPGRNPRYGEDATAVGEMLAEHGWRLVYGAGDVGLMGATARAAQAAGGDTFGVIPVHLVDKEVGKRDLTQYVVTETMHERKRQMAERCDAFLALPGGIGTFEEFFEAWTWRQLGYHDKPVGLLNTGGYYDGLMSFLRSTVEQEFMGGWQMDLIRVDSDVHRLMPELIQAAGFSPEPRLDEI